MESTSTSLLARLKQPNQPLAWERFVELYTPLLFHWVRRAGLKHPDDADLVQDVLTVLVRKLPEFDYQRDKSFRAWLRTIAINKWRDQQRRRKVPLAEGAEGLLGELAAPNDHDFSAEEHRRWLSERALTIMRSEFQDQTWRACWEFVVRGRGAAEVAAEMGISENSVYVAKIRVLRRLRKELEGLLD
jgi:RNA polymerase sigma-70 factor, ECF subfamily